MCRQSFLHSKKDCKNEHKKINLLKNNNIFSICYLRIIQLQYYYIYIIIKLIQILIIDLYYYFPIIFIMCYIYMTLLYKQIYIKNTQVIDIFRFMSNFFNCFKIYLNWVLIVFITFLLHFLNIVENLNI